MDLNLLDIQWDKVQCLLKHTVNATCAYNYKGRGLDSCMYVGSPEAATIATTVIERADLSASIFHPPAATQEEKMRGGCNHPLPPHCSYLQPKPAP